MCALSNINAVCVVHVTIFSTSFEFYVVTRYYSSHPFLRALNNSYSTGGQGFMAVVNKPCSQANALRLGLFTAINPRHCVINNVSICHVRVDMAGSESVIMSHNFIITRVSNNHHMCTN